MSKSAERLVDAILAGEPSEVISEMARKAIEKKVHKGLKRLRADWMARDVPCDEYSEEVQSEMSLDQFVEGDHRDLDREINARIEVLNERAGGFHYNALPKIHRTLINNGFQHVQSANRIHHYHRNADGTHVVATWAGYKLRLMSGQIITGRHHMHLQKQLAKYV
jgi:hypothetical protein